MAHITKKIVVNAPFSDVVPGAINSSPDFWPEWYVGLSAPTSKTGEGEVGTVSEHTMRIAGREFPITHTVVESTNDGVDARWKGTFTGAIEGWHQWTYHLVNGHTEVAVEHEYKLPAGPVGKFVDAVFVERVIAGMLEHSLENLKMLTEARVAA